MTVVLLIIVGITLIRSTIQECSNFYSRFSTSMPVLTGQVLTPTSAHKLRKTIAIGFAAPKVAEFKLLFSPDSSILGISGLGWISSAYSVTFLWKIKQFPLCILEGKILPGSGTQAYQDFSPDGQIAIVNQCYGKDGQGCYSLWRTRDHGFLRSYYYAKFIQQGNAIRLEYQQTKDMPINVGNISWNVIQQSPPTVDVLTSGSSFKLVDHVTGRLLQIGQASGQIETAVISPDKTLLALAIIQPPDEKGYPWKGSVELWSVMDSGNTKSVH